MAKQPFDWDKFLSWLEKNSFVIFQLVRLLFGIGLKKAALAIAGSKVKEFEEETRTLNDFTHMAENIGIGNAIEVAKAFGKFITLSTNIDANKDGKKEMSEWTNYGIQTITLLVKTYGFIPATLAELGDADAQERDALIKAFAGEFDITNDEAEFLIEDWFVYINASISQGAVLVKRTSRLLNKNAA